MERNRLSKNIIDVSLVAAALGAGILANIGIASSRKTNLTQLYRHIYLRSYVDHGQCLSGSSYDPSSGASVSLSYDKQTHEEILSVVPTEAHGNALHFTAGKGKINFADSYTGSLLVRAECSMPKGS